MCLLECVYLTMLSVIMPIPLSARSKALAYWDCGFESRLGHGYLSVVSVVCCQVEVSAKS
jgi:hypothetical protein